MRCSVCGEPKVHRYWCERVDALLPRSTEVECIRGHDLSILGRYKSGECVACKRAANARYLRGGSLERKQ